MKKSFFVLLLIIMTAAVLAGCGSEPALPVSSPADQVSVSEPAEDSGNSDGTGSGIATPESLLSSGDGEVDVDLTKLSSTMVYSEVFAMVMTPEDYVGKTVRMRGQLAILTDDKNKSYTYAVIQDATACCQQGLEFVWNGHPYPDAAYPQEGTEITVTGTFEEYEEDGMKYCRIISDEVEM